MSSGTSTSKNNNKNNMNTSTPRIHISLPRTSFSSSANLHASHNNSRSHNNQNNIQNSSRNNSSHSDSSDEEAEFDSPWEAPVPPIHPSPHGTAPVDATKTATTPSSNLWDGLRNQSLDFPINTECTSLRLSPSGNFLWAGFSDGTLRVFDLSGRFSLQTQDSSLDITSSATGAGTGGGGGTARQKSSTRMLLPSKFHQRFGAVACQIHARGVHTDLIMQVDLCGDYVFGGVPRGANELYAVNTKDLEEQSNSSSRSNDGASSATRPNQQNILDSLQVHVYADAKLKGFGACAQLGTDNAFGRPTYLLLTGKGIKNIHIWKFQPPRWNHHDSQQEEAIWEQLYDTPTNGNTIHLLSFYRTPLGKLWGVSQSDTQKLRLWDLSREDDDGVDYNGHDKSGTNGPKPRPKRPNHQDVANSQGALGIAGGYGVCGGPTMYNQLSIVSLDQPKSAYNHTELALPGAQMDWSSLSIGAGGGRGRQRRGDLKQVVNVAGLPNDSNHALLELDDGSIVHYAAADPKAGRPNLKIVTEKSTGIAALPAEFWSRTLCLGKAAGLVVAAVGMYNPNTQLGHIEVRALERMPMSPPLPPSSPVAMDNRALSRLCMEAPPVSLMKKNKKKKPALEPLQQAPINVNGVGITVGDKTLHLNSATLATPRPSMIMKSERIETFKATTLSSTSAEHVPISVEKSMKKRKKKKNLSNDCSSSRQTAAAATLPSVEKGNREAKSVPVEQIKKKKPIAPLASLSSRAAAAAAANPQSVSPITEERFSFERKKVVPLSAPPTEGKLSGTVVSWSLPPQVSPSASTPTAAANQGLGETPWSTESNNKADRGTIAKFLKPVRVLHNYSETDNEKQKQQQQQPLLEKVASPPVPRKIRKTSDESQPTKNVVAQGPIEKTTESVKSNDFDGTRVEFKVPMALKIQVSPKSLDLSDAKRPSAATNSISSSDGGNHKRQRTEATPECTLVNVATMLVDLKSPPMSRTKPATSRNNSNTDLTRDEYIISQAKEEHKKLCQLIDSLPKHRSRLLRSQSMDSFVPQSPYTRVSNEHRACHDMIQKRLLHSAEFTLRSLVDNHITLDGARSKLIDAIRSYQEVLHDTLKRQELELEVLVDENGKVPRLPVVSYRSAFDKVEEIYKTLEPAKRPPGRPKGSV